MRYERGVYTGRKTRDPHKVRIFIELMTWTVNLRRPERARNEGSIGPKRLDDTRCTTHKRQINYRACQHCASTTSCLCYQLSVLKVNNGFLKVNNLRSGHASPGMIQLRVPAHLNASLPHMHGRRGNSVCSECHLTSGSET